MGRAWQAVYSADDANSEEPFFVPRLMACCIDLDSADVSVEALAQPTIERGLVIPVSCDGIIQCECERLEPMGLGEPIGYGL